MHTTAETSASSFPERSSVGSSAAGRGNAQPHPFSYPISQLSFPPSHPYHYPYFHLSYGMTFPLLQILQIHPQVTPTHHIPLFSFILKPYDPSCVYWNPTQPNPTSGFWSRSWISPTGPETRGSRRRSPYPFPAPAGPPGITSKSFRNRKVWTFVDDSHIILGAHHPFQWASEWGTPTSHQPCRHTGTSVSRHLSEFT